MAISGGLRWEHYDTEFRAQDAAGVTTTELQVAIVLSAASGIVYRIHASGNAYVSYGLVTPPATQLQPERAGQQSEQPERQPQSPRILGREQRGLRGGRLSVNGAVFRKRTRTSSSRGCRGHPPIYNQDDANSCGHYLGAMGRITDRWEVLANVVYSLASCDTDP